MQTFFAPQLLAFGLSLGIPLPQGIVGGIAVEPVDPITASTVLILQTHEKSGQVVFFCSGSLVAPDLVVTAAHCVHNEGKGKGPALPPDRFVIYPQNLLSPQDFDPSKAVRVSAAVSHPQYTARFDLVDDLHDIALLRLADPAPGSLRPADILPAGRKLQSNEKVVVAGYGFTKVNQSQTNEFILHKFTNYVFQRFKHDLAKLKGSSNRGSHRGDSGGPAFIEESGAIRLWGVFSGSIISQGEAYYMDLRQEKKWLERTATEIGTSLRLP